MVKGRGPSQPEVEVKVGWEWTVPGIADQKTETMISPPEAALRHYR